MAVSRSAPGRHLDRSDISAHECRSRSLHIPVGTVHTAERRHIGHSRFQLFLLAVLRSGSSGFGSRSRKSGNYVSPFPQAYSVEDTPCERPGGRGYKRTNAIGVVVSASQRALWTFVVPVRGSPRPAYSFHWGLQSGRLNRILA